MKEETIEGDLIVHGDIFAGTNGILEAAGFITTMFCGAPEGSRHEEIFQPVPKKDLNLQDRHIVVYGTVLVWGDIHYDLTNYTGYITAGNVK